MDTWVHLEQDMRHAWDILELENEMMKEATYWIFVIEIISK